jgi:hypothetical protein
MHLLFIDLKKAHNPVSKREVLYNNLTGFGIPMKLVIIINVSINETYSRVRVVKHLSDMFPIKNGSEQRDSLLRLFFNSALEYAIKRIWGNKEGLKLNCTYQRLVYAYNVHILHGSIHTTRRC